MPPFQTPGGQLIDSGGRGRMMFFRWGWDGGNGSVRYGSPQEPVEILCL